MRHDSILYSSAAALLIATMVVATGFVSAAKPPASGGIDGYVYAQGSGLGIGNAFVEVVGAGKSEYTDVNGYYKMLKIPAGTYSLQVSVSGYITQTRDNVQVISGTTSHCCQLRAHSTWSLRRHPEELKGMSSIKALCSP